MKHFFKVIIKVYNFIVFQKSDKLVKKNAISYL